MYAILLFLLQTYLKLKINRQIQRSIKKPEITIKVAQMKVNKQFNYNHTLG